MRDTKLAEATYQQMITSKDPCVSAQTRAIALMPAGKLEAVRADDAPGTTGASARSRRRLETGRCSRTNGHFR